MKVKFDENVFYPEINANYSEKLFDKLILGKNIEINNEDKRSLIREKAKYKQKNIKILCELLIRGEKVEDIKNMEKLEIPNIELNSNKSSFPLYYLLLNMPSGLPDCFLELIFDDYANIKDDKKIIISSIVNNWNLINKDKKFKETFKENERMDKCFKALFKTLKLYTELLQFFIEKNREKIITKNGDIHYIFNSYNNRKVWKSKIPNTIGKILGENIYDENFKIENHKHNIMSLISLVTDKIELFRKIEESTDDYLEEILLLFPSFYFLKKDNIKLLQDCIYLCMKLINDIEESEKKIKMKIIVKVKKKIKMIFYLKEKNIYWKN